MTILWTEKYRPTKVAEIVGNKQAVAEFLEWIDGWVKHKPPKKAALLYGPAGVGKTSLVHAYAKEKGFEIIEMNASDFRTRENVERIVGAASSMSSLATVSKKIILVDEVDGLDARADAGAVSTLVQIIAQSRVPIVLVANDPWDPKLAPLRESSIMIKFSKIPKPSIGAHLKKIAASEKIKISEEDLRRIVEHSDGDLRSAINDLQITAAATFVEIAGERDREADVFESLAKVFHSKTFASAQDALTNLDIEPYEFFRWVLDNAPNQLSPHDLADALENLSRADLYFQRINTKQAWHYLRYATALMTAGVSLSRNTTPSRYVKFSYPESIKFLGQTKSVREKVEAISAKVGKKLHMSTRKAKTDFLPYLKVLLEINGEDLVDFLGLSDDEVDFLRGGEARKQRGRGSG